MKRSMRFLRGAILLPCALFLTTAQAATEQEKLAAIQNGLAHLYAIQQPGGYWDYFGAYEQSITGAAAYAFLSQQDRWPAAKTAQYQTGVDKAMQYLLATATFVTVGTRSDGAVICPGGAATCPAVYWYGNGETTYTTGLVAPAISLYGLSKGASAVATNSGPLAGMTWAQIAQAITNTFAHGQSTAASGNRRGGWRYFPGTGDSDSSTTQWAVISLLYDADLGAVMPAILKTDLAFWLAVVQAADGSVCYQPGAICDHSDTGGWLLAKKLVGAGLDPAVIHAMQFLSTNWTEDANGTWFGNFGHPYATWSVYKGLGTTVGLLDTTHIGPPLKTDCGASRNALPGNPPGSVPCNWWEDYNEYLVTTQNGDGSWGGYSNWVDPLSTAFYVNILAAVAIPPNHAPIAQCKNVTVPADAACVASASVDNGSYDPDAGDTITLSQTPAGPYHLGSNPVVLTVKDQYGAEGVCAATVTVVDQTPPTVTSSVAMSSLWPPDHTLINVGLSANATDNCVASLVLGVKVYGTEDDEIQTGDGNFSPDAKDLKPGTLRLRSERTGTGDGRIYLIVTTATDGAPNLGVSCSTVVVAKSQSSANKTAIAAAAAAAKAYCEAHNGAPPAGYVVIGDGPVIGPLQ